MHSLRTPTVALLAVLLLCTGCSADPEQVAQGSGQQVDSAAQGQPPAPAVDYNVDPERPYLTPTHRDLGPAAVIDRIRRVAAERRLTYAEQFDHGSALIQQGRCAEAATAYEAAAGQAEDDRQRVLAYLMAAQAAGLVPTENDRITATEASRRAGELANRAQRFAPGNAEVAGYRYGFWSAAGDDLEAAAAHALVSRRDLRVNGEAVLEPATVAIIVGVSAGILTIWAYEEGLLTQSEASMLVTTAITVVLGASRSTGTGRGA